MPNPAIKIAVLVLSLGLGAVYVWKSAKGNRPAEPRPHPAPKTAAPSENPVTVTDEEVTKHREMLLQSSKSGLIMSDAEIRKMLEEMKRAASLTEGAQAPRNLIPSSKSSAVLDPAELKDIPPLLRLFRQEDSAPPKEESKDPPTAPEDLIPSSKASSFLIDRQDVELLLESFPATPKPAPEETKKE